MAAPMLSRQSLFDSWFGRISPQGEGPRGVGLLVLRELYQGAMRSSLTGRSSAGLGMGTIINQGL